MLSSTPVIRAVSALAGITVSLALYSTPAAAVAPSSPTPDSGDIFEHVQVAGNTDASLLSSEAYAQARLYVDATKKSWDLAYQHDYWTQQSAELSSQVEAAQYDLSVKRATADATQEKYDISLNAMAELARSIQRGDSSPVSSDLALFIGGADSMQDVIDSQEAEQLYAQFTANTMAQAEADGKAATAALETAEARDQELHQMLEDASSFTEKAASALTESQVELDRAKRAWVAVWVASPQAGTSVLNAAIANEWNEYLDELKALGIEIPAADELVNTNSYPAGLSSTTGLYVLDTTGVAMYEGVVVPSRESILRVSNALSNLGKTYGADGDGSSSWGCQPFVSSMLGGTTDQEFGEIFSEGGRQNLSVKDSQPGDIVFFADPQAGIHQAGIYVFGGMVVNASAASGRVSIDSVGADALTSVRPRTSILNNDPAPTALPGALDWKCGGIVGLNGGPVATWTLPVSEYALGVHFKETNPRYTAFSEGSPGLEFLTTSTLPVRADFAGIVIESGEDPQWGVTVAIQHADGSVTRYSSLASVSTSIGAEVVGGSTVGTTGSTGSMALPGGGVLVSMSISGTYFNPEDVFFSPVQGQYANGQIPASALCPLSIGGLLRCDAARAFEVLSAAYLAYFGTPIVATDTYRSLSGQIKCTAEKGGMCATPGTSNHGWGLAVDFGDGINSFGTPQHIWMTENAEKYGWYHPSWAQQDGSKPEPWHWEYVATK